MSQLAWLNAVPGRTECDSPPLDDYSQWLLATLFRIGVANNGAAVFYAEIKAWCELSGIELTLWEAESLRKLSNFYLGETHFYSDKEHQKLPAPYETEETALERKALAAKLRWMMLKARAA